jgi:hypothetical protein
MRIIIDLVLYPEEVYDVPKRSNLSYAGKDKNANVGHTKQTSLSHFWRERVFYSVFSTLHDSLVRGTPDKGVCWESLQFSSISGG